MYNQRQAKSSRYLHVQLGRLRSGSGSNCELQASWFRRNQWRFSTAKHIPIAIGWLQLDRSRRAHYQFSTTILLPMVRIACQQIKLNQHFCAKTLKQPIQCQRRTANLTQKHATVEWRTLHQAVIVIPKHFVFFRCSINYFDKITFAPASKLLQYNRRVL